MLNRTAILLRYKEPFVRWINETDPDPEGTEIAVRQDEQTAYLIHTIENRDDLDDWIALNYETLFEMELWQRYTDEALWPSNRTLEERTLPG